MIKELDYLYEKTVACNVCLKKYTTRKVLSKYIRVNKHDSDFCSYYASTKKNPLLYYVQVCPNCGYSSSEEFTSFFPPTTLNTIKEKISANWNGDDYCKERTLDQTINSYKLAIYCATIKKEKHIALAGVYLRLAWIYRTEKVNIEEENRFIRLALNEYMNSYMNGDFTDTHLSEIKLMYIIGDLSKRTGSIGQATKYFSRVIEMQRKTSEKGIVEMAKNRWAEMREKKLG